MCIRDSFNIMDISSHEIRAYKASVLTKSVDNLQDNTEYIILGLCKHPFRTGFKYVLKVKENAEKSYPVMCKSSYFIEQLLNQINVCVDMPFILFKTEKSSVTPKKHKAMFVYLDIDDKYKIDPAGEADAAASSSTT